MKLLLISYEFPPSGGVAVQRSLSFAKYLPENGFEVHVLTARNPASPVKDPGLLRHVPPQVRVHRAWTLEPPYYLRQKLWRAVSGVTNGNRPGPVTSSAPARGGVKKRLMEAVKQAFSPDPHVLWLPLAYRRACRIIQRYGIEAVLTTVPPFSMLLLANRLKRRYPHLKFINDFRDEWRRYFLEDFEFLKSPRTRERAEQIERQAIVSADLVLAATRSSLSQIRAGHPDQPESKFAWIANGYDPESFRSFRSRPHEQGKIIVTYIGTVYKVCSPRYYLDALDELPEDVRSRFETRFIGRVIEDERQFLEGRRSDVRVLGFLPQAEAFRWMEETDYLLVTVTNDFAIAGKLFEYLPTGKPILAISPPDGEVGRLVRETGAGVCVAPEDSAGIREMLIAAAQRSAGIGASRKTEEVTRYERPRLAGALARLIRGGEEVEAAPAHAFNARTARG